MGILRIKRMVVNFGKTICRGTKSSWEKYHFLIPPKVIKKDLKFLWSIITEGSGPYVNPFDKVSYNDWLNKNEKPVEITSLKYKPLISVLIPVYNVDGEYLKECIDSVLGQSYDNFEICIVDDASTKQDTLDMLRAYENNPKVKIKYRKKNGHISVTSNDALKMARGEFVALMDNDDILSNDALFVVAKVLNDDKKIDFIYSDEDKIDMDGKRCDPNFKSDYAPDSLYSGNYISHLGVLRKSVVEEVGGFRKGFEGAQDYDLYLRVLERTTRVYHIPRIFYHWRMIPGSTAAEIDNKDYALEHGRKAIEESLKRRKLDGMVKIADGCPYYYVEYKVRGNPKVTIIIPTRDHADITRKCLESIYNKTTYNNYEIVIVDNGSTEQGTKGLFEEYEEEYENFRVIKADIEFNYATLNNIAAKETKGDYLVLLNNDIEVITPNWIELMLGYAEQEHIGAVGAKLLYPDGLVQHAGVILGLGVASHAFLGESDGVVWGGRLSVPYNYSAVTGACLMVSRKKWDEVGGLEEDLKVTYNDIDFCLKLLEKGYYNVFVPMAKLYHYESKSRGADTSGEKKERFDWEQNYMRKKWTDRIKDDEFYNPNYSRLSWYKLDKSKNA